MKCEKKTLKGIIRLKIQSGSDNHAQIYSTKNEEHVMKNIFILTALLLFSNNALALGSVGKQLQNTIWAGDENNAQFQTFMRFEKDKLYMCIFMKGIVEDARWGEGANYTMDKNTMSVYNKGDKNAAISKFKIINNGSIKKFVRTAVKNNKVVTQKFTSVKNAGRCK